MINSIPNRDDVDAILQSLDLMFHTNITSKSSRRTAERELEDCKRTNDELVEYFGKRLLHLLAKAYPATDAATTNTLACKLFLKGIRCNTTGPILNEFRDARGEEADTTFAQLLEKAISLELNYNLVGNRKRQSQSTAADISRATRWSDAREHYERRPSSTTASIPTAAHITTADNVMHVSLYSLNSRC